MKRKLFIVAGALLGLVVLGVAALFVFIDPDDIKNEALARARETTGYSIEAGPASLKLGFTGAGVRLQDVFLESPDTLQTIRADHVDVLVKILPLLGRKVELSRVSVGNGLYVRRSPAGTMTLTEVNLSGGLAWDAQAGGAGNLGGDLGGGSFEGETGTLPIPAASFKARFEMSAEQDRFAFSDVELKSGGLKGAFAGEYAQVGGQVPTGQGGPTWEGELRGSLEPVKWSDLVALIPPENLVALGDAEIEGTLAVPEVVVRTEGDATTTAGVLTFSELSAKAPSAPLGLSAASGTVRFSPETVTLEDGQGKLGENPVKLTGSLSGGAGKLAEVHVDTRIDGATLGKLMPAEAGVSLSKGSVVVDLGARGAFPFESAPALDGSVSLDGLEGSYGDLPLRKTGGAIHFKGSEARIENLHASLGRSDFALSGTAPDISDPWFRFTLESNVIDVNELFPEEDRKKNQDGEGGPAIGLPGTGTVRIGTLHVRKLDLQNIRGNVRMALDGVDLTSLQGTAYGGEVSGGMTMKPTETPGIWRYDSDIDLVNVGIGEFLLGWSDLGRVVEGSLNGKLNMDGLAGGDVDARKAFNLNGDLGMRDGRLLDFPVLLSLGQVLGISGVDHERWPFKSLDANVTVRDGKMVLNAFELAQPGFDWTVEGLVGLEGELTLNGIVRADPTRVNLVGQGLGQVAAEPDGRIPIPFTVEGTLMKPRPDIDWDAFYRRAGEKAKEDLNRELKRRLEGAVADSTVQKLFDGVVSDSTLKKSPLGKFLGGKGGG